MRKRVLRAIAIVVVLSFRPSPNILTAGWVHSTIKK